MNDDDLMSEDEDGDADHSGSKRRKIAPNTEEIQQLNAASELFKNNLFRLQVMGLILDDSEQRGWILVVFGGVRNCPIADGGTAEGGARAILQDHHYRGLFGFSQDRPLHLPTVVSLPFFAYNGYLPLGQSAIIEPFCLQCSEYGSFAQIKKQKWFSARGGMAKLISPHLDKGRKDGATIAPLHQGLILGCPCCDGASPFSFVSCACRRCGAVSPQVSSSFFSSCDWLVPDPLCCAAVAQRRRWNDLAWCMYCAEMRDRIPF